MGAAGEQPAWRTVVVWCVAVGSAEFLVFRGRRRSVSRGAVGMGAIAGGVEFAGW